MTPRQRCLQPPRANLQSPPPQYPGRRLLKSAAPRRRPKIFEQALEADPKFAVARLNLGIALLNQQKAEAARDMLLQAAQQLPNDPYAWYNLGLAYKDLADSPSAGVAAFEHVTQILPTETDAYYFVGYLIPSSSNTIKPSPHSKKASRFFPTTLPPNLASPAPTSAKATPLRREHLAKFQNITTNHLGTPFGAGYGDQGRLSLAELITDPTLAVPPRFPCNSPHKISTRWSCQAKKHPRSAPALAPASSIMTATASPIFPGQRDRRWHQPLTPQHRPMASSKTLPKRPASS